MLKIIVVLGGSIFLSACQTMSITECRTANWADLGDREGSKGFSDRSLSRAESCQKQGISIPKVELERYRLSYNKSIRQYCQPENIFNRAMVGEAKINACPEPQHGRVKPIYDVVTRYYDNKKNIDRLRKEIFDLEDRLMVNTDKQLKDKWLLERARKSRELDRLREDEHLLERDLDYVRPR